MRPPAHDRDRRATARTSAIRIAVDRADGVILRLEESIGGVVTRDAGVTEYEPDAPLPPTAFDFVVPDRDDDALLSGSRIRDRSERPADGRAFVVGRGSSGSGLGQLEVALDRGQLLGGALDLGALEPVLRRDDPPDASAAEDDEEHDRRVVERC